MVEQFLSVGEIVCLCTELKIVLRQNLAAIIGSVSCRVGEMCMYHIPTTLMYLVSVNSYSESAAVK